MTQPVWETPAGSLGTIPEGIFYSVSVRAEADDEDVFFQLIAGQLPDGVQITANGVVEGIPKNVIKVQGVPQEVSEDVTSRFAIRAFTRNLNGSIARLADRTFSLTVTGQDIPEFVTPPGNVGTFYDGSEARVQIEFTDIDTTDIVTIRLLSGSLPSGLVLDSRTGVISGIILPLTGNQGPGTTPPSRNFDFTLEITDGKQSNVRNFSIFVFSKASMNASATDITADTTFVTADQTPDYTPILLNREGSLGVVQADNFYAYKFNSIDFDGDEVEYSVTLGAGIGFDAANFNNDPGSYDSEGFDRGALALPPGLSIDPVTGWFYGYIPDQGATEETYRFALRVFKKNDPTIISRFYYFTITITGNIATEVTWLTDFDLGSINNGAISTLFVEAVNVGGRSLQYRMAGSDNSLPQGLTLQPSGIISGRVSFNTFALDGGTTTFDKELNTRLDINETTFDSKFSFTVNAFSGATEQVGYQVGSIIVTNGGSGYTSQPTVTISSPPETENAIQATAGVATIVNGVITGISVGNPGRGYTVPPIITISGGGGVGASASARIIEAELTNSVSVFRRFTITVNRAFNEPYESLYIKCMPPADDRALIDQLIQNQDIIPDSAVYRAGDSNFGVATSVIYNHAYGLTAASLDDYVQSLDLNHYWRYLTLGEVKTAQAVDANGNVVYEVIYSEIIDNLVNNQGESVGKEVDLAYPVMPYDDSMEISVVYPNSLINMRDQVIDTVGQISPALPLWMTSKQANGRVLGFVPAWVIAYVNPGESGRIAYFIRELFGDQLNTIDYKVDRYELYRGQTYNWDPATSNWIPNPAVVTEFDNDTTIFDNRNTRFIAPADQYTGTDEFDKYLVFPKRTILG
jgi:hypothetical protein